ncbi:hypothetical protein KQX54_013399 [Cotesia glomerata]|uniref:Uncharacterized protein n=1 Tax=Cotesia glomerata TaxID=32391 RepID=A0AAV7I5N7_COTGL|nr:hypothetical protein KQX54_013399 [Cotesia glomerata]
MPPKKNTTGKKISKKAFALIWWVQEGTKDIIPACKIPNKSRTPGSIIKLKWENFKTKIVGLHEAKIIAIDTNYEELNTILLDDKGNVHDFADKLFVKDVLERKRKAADDAKDIKNSKVAKRSSFEDELSGTSSLFSHRKSSMKLDKPPVLSTNISPVIRSVEVTDTSRNLSYKTNESGYSQMLACVSSPVTSASNDQQFKLINLSKRNNDASAKVNENVSQDDTHNTPVYAFSSNTMEIPPSTFGCHSSDSNHSGENYDTFMKTIETVEKKTAAHTTSNHTMTIPSASSKCHILDLSLENSRNLHCNKDVIIKTNYQPSEPLNFSTKSNNSSGTLQTNNDTFFITADVTAHEDFDQIYPANRKRTKNQEPFMLTEESNVPNGVEQSYINNEVEEINCTEKTETAEISIGALHTFMPNNVTIDDIQQFERVYAGIKKAHEQQIKSNANLCAAVEIEIWIGSGLYLSQAVVTSLKKNSVDKKGNPSWKKFVTLVILEVYGDNIGNFSANGKRGCEYPSIDSNFFEALFSWVKSKFTTEKITKQSYSSVINGIAWKKRTKITSVAFDQISENNLQFFGKIVSALKKNVAWQEEAKDRDMQVKDLLEPGSDKAKISESYHIYFPKDAISYIQRKSTIANNISDWKVLVKDALLEIYKSDLINYSAKGTRSNKSVGIDQQVYKAILAWARSRTKETITDTEFVNYVNKIISNKRLYIKNDLPLKELTPNNNINIELENCQGSTSQQALVHLETVSPSGQYLVSSESENIIQQSLNVLQYEYDDGSTYLNM